MLRAAVLIGVAKAGKLQGLNDAIGGALRMKAWALANDFAEENVHVFTDAGGPVLIGDIQRSIHALVDSGTVAQLIVYFAGHGVNIGYSEYWLLSGAPIDGAAAVNVAASVECARKCGIPHVVFISDACRTPAATIRAQGIHGSVIFPNDPIPGPEQDVDIFFAATLGQPALELQDMRMADAPYRAIYTDAFLDGLNGKMADAVRAGDEGMLVVRPRPLKDSLFTEIPRRFGEKGFIGTIPPCPDARITSGEHAWLARFPGTLPAPSDTSRPRAGTPRAPNTMELASLHVRTLLQQIGHQSSSDWAGHRSPEKRSDPPSPWYEMDWTEPEDAASTIHMRGGRLLRCLARGAHVDNSEPAIRLHLDSNAADILLVFEDGSCAVVPVLRGHDLRVTLKHGALVDLMYSRPVPLESALQAAPLSLLHDAVAAAALTGWFDLEGKSEHRFLQLLERTRRIDPALALYAAYAFHRRHAREPIRRLHQLLLERNGFVPFDMALLLNLNQERAARVHPPFPLIAQGWALLAARSLPIPELLATLRRHLMPSLWSHFNKDGTRLLQSYFEKGD